MAFKETVTQGVDALRALPKWVKAMLLVQFAFLNIAYFSLALLTGYGDTKVRLLRAMVFKPDLREMLTFEPYVHTLFHLLFWCLALAIFLGMLLTFPLSKGKPKAS